LGQILLVLFSVLLVALTYAQKFMVQILHTMEYYQTTDSPDDFRFTLCENLATPAAAVNDILAKGIQIADQCFAVLLGSIAVQVQPGTHNVNVVSRVALVLLLYSYYWLLLYSLRLV
jgi:hypothetical protein